MPTTPNSKLPYPASTDPADVPADMQKLATALDEIAYAETTANVTVTTASLVDVVTSPAITYAATPIIVEFHAAELEVGAQAGAQILLYLWDGSTDLGLIGFWLNPAANILALSALQRRRITPAAGSHTYRVRAQAANQPGKISAGNGTVGQYSPAYIRVTHA